MLQWILQHHLKENVLKIGLCAEAAALLLEMVRVTVDKVSILLQVQWSVNGRINCLRVSDVSGSLYLQLLAFLSPHRAIVSIIVSRDFKQSAQLLAWLCYIADVVMGSCLRSEHRDGSYPQH